MANKRKTPAKSWKSKAKTQAKKGNYQDAFADDERSKGYGKSKGGRNGAISNGTGDNDPKWYIPTEIMAKDVANISFDYALGRSTLINTVQLGVQAEFLATPGIITYYTIPSVGSTIKGKSAPVNVAMDTLFAAIRQKVSGTTYYEAPNLINYILAMDSLYSYYAFLVRAYGVMCRPRTVLNRYEPEVVIYSMGLDYMNLFTNLSQFRTYINQFAYRLTALPVPDGLDYMARHVFLYENLYMDSETSKAQLYMYSPFAFMQYREDTLSPDGFPEVKLEAKPLLRVGQYGIYSSAKPGTNSQYLTYADLIKYGEELISPVLGSDTIRFIASDIIKVFGSSLYTISQIAETYTVDPIYNKEVLMQFENTFIHPMPRSIDNELTGDVSRMNFDWFIDEVVGLNQSYLKAVYRYFPATPYYGKLEDADVGKIKLAANRWNLQQKSFTRGVLNFHQNDVSVEDIFVATRLSSTSGGVMTVDSENPIVLHYNIENPGSEVVIGAMFAVMAHPSENLEINWVPFSSQQIIENKVDSLISVYDKIAQYTAFDWSPRSQLYVCKPMASVTSNDWIVKVTQCVSELDNFGFISELDLANLNEVALFAQLNFRDRKVLR